MKRLAILLLMALSACQTGEPLAKCKGHTFGLNPEQWHPTSADVKPCPRNVEDEA